MEIYTERLILRPWAEADAEDLYEHAKDPAVGPIAGWPVHTSVENSREVIRTVLSAREVYAVCLKKDNRAIGSVGLMVGEASHFGISDREAELGYWLGVPFWGQGLIPEACAALLRHGFEALGLDTVWCGYYEGNEKSRRVQEKCGFCHQRTLENVPCEELGDIRTEQISSLTKQQWKENRRQPHE